MKNREKGIISIFLALILIPTYTLSLASLDISRIYAGKNYIKLANESAITSVLLNYDKKLYEKYNLLAVSNLENAKNISKKVVEENLFSPDDNENFHKFTKIETDLNTEIADSLVNTKELERQIIDYMRYKGPLELMDGFISMLETMKNAKTYNNILSKKMSYNEELEKFNGKLSELSNDLAAYKGEADKIVSTYDEFVKEYQDLKKELKAAVKVEDKINEKEEKSSEDLELIKENNKKTKKLKNEFIKKYEAFSSTLSKQIFLNKTIKEETLLINSNNSKLDSKLKEWKKSIEDTPSSEIKNQFRTEYTFSNKSFSKDNVDALVNQLDKNLEILEKMNRLLFLRDGQMKGLRKSNKDFLENSLNAGDFKVNKLSNLERFALYKRLATIKSKVKVDGKKKSEAKKLRNLMDDFNDKSELEKSNKDSIFNYISKDDYNSIINNEYAKDSTDYKKLSITNLSDNLSLLNLDFNLSSPNFINNFLIAQYISDKFSDKTIDFGDKILTQKEFIVFGNADFQKNMNNARNLIFAIRLALNAMYGFTSPEVRKEALALATAIAGWTGLGVPLVEGLIVSAMSFGESLLDTSKLTKGQSLGLFKNKSSWTFSITGIKRLAKENAFDFVKQGIGNVMDSVEQIAIEAKDHTFETLNTFVGETASGVEQGLVGSIIIPIQNTVVDLINDPTKDKENELNAVFANLNSSLSDSSNPEINRLTKETITYLESNFKNRLLTLTKSEEIDNDSIINVIEEMNNNVNGKVKDFTEGISNSLKSKITNIISLKSNDYQTEIQKAINSYFDNISTKKSDKLSMSKQSGLSFSYSDYIKLFTFIKLNGSEKYDILNRLALVIDIEMKNINGNFSIVDTYTNFKINTKASIPMIIDIFEGKNKKKVIENEMQLSYKK